MAMAGTGWQKLAAFRRGQKWPQKFSSGYVRDKCVVFARNCKLANLIECNIQYISCKNAFLAPEKLFLTLKKTLFFVQSVPKSA